MTSKLARQRVLLRLVTEEVLSTQAELRRALGSHGHAVDQATLSRDLRELGVVKLALPDAGRNGRRKYRYAAREQLEPVQFTPNVRGLIHSVRSSGNTVVVRTDPGNANRVAYAIDRLDWHEVLGTVAGDDTLFVLVDESHAPVEVLKKLEGLNT